MEQDRLDMTHHVFRLTLDGELCITKLDQPHEILDIGTGTGMWVCVLRLDPSIKDYENEGTGEFITYHPTDMKYFARR